MKLVWIETAIGPQAQIWHDWNPMEPPRILQTDKVLERHEGCIIDDLKKLYPLRRVKDETSNTD